MHEVGIARNILEQIENQLPPDTADKVKTIRIKLGEKAGVTADALRFGFQVANVYGPLANAELVIDEVPLRVQCEDCGEVTNILHPLLTCEACGNARMKVLSGNELEVVEVLTD